MWFYSFIGRIQGYKIMWYIVTWWRHWITQTVYSVCFGFPYINIYSWSNGVHMKIKVPFDHVLNRSSQYSVEGMWYYVCITNCDCQTHARVMVQKLSGDYLLYYFGRNWRHAHVIESWLSYQYLPHCISRE